MAGHAGDRWHLVRAPRPGDPLCHGECCGVRWRKPRVPTSRHRRGLRWQAEYEAGGRMHYPAFATEEAAKNHLAKVLADELRGTYRDESTVRTTVREYATEVFLPSRTSDDITRDRLASVFRVHILPALGDRRLRDLEDRPAVLDDWVGALRKSLKASSANQVITALSTMLARAVRDKLLSSNPCDGLGRPGVPQRHVEPWTPETVAAVRAALPARWQAITDAGTGTGARQGELFAFALEDLDMLRRQVRIRVQVKIVRGRLWFSVLKSRKIPERTVPLARQTADALALHLARFPAVPVELPWHEPDNKRRHGKPVTRHLLFTTETGGALDRNVFNHHWRDAVQAAGLESDRVNGCHMMRHVFASRLVAAGLDVVTVAAMLGHADKGALVLRTYAHLTSGAQDRTRKALEEALSDPLAAVSDLT